MSYLGLLKVALAVHCAIAHIVYSKSQIIKLRLHFDKGLHKYVCLCEAVHKLVSFKGFQVMT